MDLPLHNLLHSELLSFTGGLSGHAAANCSSQGQRSRVKCHQNL